jgi:hypothetical protein
MKRLLGITGLVSLLFAVPIAMQIRKNSIEDKIKVENKVETQDEEGIFKLVGYISDDIGQTYTKRTLLRFKGKAEIGELKDLDNDQDQDFIFDGFIIENDKKIYGTFVSENDGKGNYSKPKLKTKGY